MQASASLGAKGFRELQMERLRRIGMNAQSQADLIMNNASETNAAVNRLRPARASGSSLRAMPRALPVIQPSQHLTVPLSVPETPPYMPVAAAPRTNPAHGRKVGKTIKNQIDMKYNNLSKAFRAMDHSQDRKLSSDELLKAVAAWNLSCSPHDIEALMESCDENGDGHIDYQEFQRGMARLEQSRSGEVFGRNDAGVVNNFHSVGGGQVIFNDNLQSSNAAQIGIGPAAQSYALPQTAVAAGAADLQKYIRQLNDKVETKYSMMRNAFRAIDSDHNGYLSREELIEAVQHFALPIPIAHVNQLFDDISDVNKDGKLSYDEFAKLLKRHDVNIATA